MSKETTCNAAFKTSWSWVGACESLGRCAHRQNCLDICRGQNQTHRAVNPSYRKNHSFEYIYFYTCTYHKNMYVFYSLYTCLMPYPLQFDHSYMGVRTRVAHPNQSVSFWLFTSTAVGPTLWPQLCSCHDCRAECSPGDFGGSKFGSCTVCVVVFINIS